MTIKTNVYVDGFNFYYGSLKDSPYRWLNILQLCKVILPNNDFQSIKYFTARSKPTEDDQGISVRQLMYFRALQTLPNLKIIEGNFQTHNAWRKLVRPMTVLVENPINGNKTASEVRFAEVLITSEKGSDVNLASNLLIDGFSGSFDCAVIISNDSDLLAPIRYVKQHLRKPVIVLNPHTANSRELERYASKIIKINATHLAQSQFDSELSDRVGVFQKPSSWC